ncbi:MAG TPA: asparagine synthase-related protein [Terriglobales bacterium]|jgi:asparagine synthase (glutamine-hydrolysing)|nr:asparagine synthase-related protein [Terriglobales bacterium]
MSVQAGIWNFDGRPVDRKLLENLSDSLRQQSPDGESYYVDNSIALLYRPFHTTAESRREKQPHVSRRGFVLTWDGRLDNREGLVSDLRSDLDASPTDLAIFAAAFDRWDTDCFRRIVGDWAVSIWKPEQRELLFAGDYMGIRHNFYYLKNDRIWWSSDLSPLVLLSGDKFHIDDDYIAGYLANDPDAHLTPYREIREAPPGQFVRVRNGRAVVQRYWRFGPKSRIRYKTDAEYEEHFRYVFRQSVRRRLRSDSPILAELSGGLDSSSIVCMADDILANEGAQTPRLDTLSFYDRTEPNGDDWIYFPKIEERRGRVGCHIDASNLGRAPASLVYTEFNPLPGSLPSGQSLEAERAAAVRDGGYKAILSGIGGDEFVGGIPNPTAQLADLIVEFKLVSLARHLMAWSLVKRRPWIHLLLQAVTELLPASLAQYLVKETKLEPWIKGDFAKRTRLPVRLLGPTESFGLWLPTRRSHVGGVLLMANKLAKWESSVLALEEARYPYLDQNLIEFILSIPASQLLRPGERRSLMRRSLVGCVPQEILLRRTKQLGARTPVVALEKNWKQLQMAFDSALSSSLGYISQDRFLETLNAVRNGEAVHIMRLLRTVSLELWLRDLASRRLIAGSKVSPPIATALAPAASA